MRTEDGSVDGEEAILEGSGTRSGETFGCSYELLLLMAQTGKKTITSEWKLTRAVSSLQNWKERFPHAVDEKLL